MKKSYLIPIIYFVCIISTIIISSCQKEAPARIIELFTFKVNNTPADVKSITTKIQAGNGNRNYLQIIASLANGDMALVEIFYNEIGERDLLDVTKGKAGLVYQIQGPNTMEWYEASGNYPAGSGKINIIKNDLNARTIRGSFFGTVVNAHNQLDKKIITEGSFAVRY